MSFYVYRTREARADDVPALVDPVVGRKVGWTGPIRSERQAEREAQAWREAGHSATVEPSTPDVRKRARTWQRAADKALGRGR